MADVIALFNAGSSSLKHALYDRDGAALGSGVIEGTAEPGAQADAAAEVLGELQSEGVVATGHRVVHGGDLSAHSLIGPETEAALERASVLAPLHNPPALAVIRRVREELGTGVPAVAALDTAFFASIPENARHYPIPRDLAEKHGIRRYGFHGLAHESMLRHTAEVLEKPAETVNAITLQLGNGCSAALIKHGQAVDMSMGMTPLEGLMMGTRSGSVDPALVAILADGEGLDADEVVAILNSRSGLLGVSGLSADMREIEDAAASGDRPAALALEMFVYRVRLQIGSFLAAAGEEIHAIVFGGGIGENSDAVRAAVVSGLAHLGVGSAISVLAAPVDEMAVMARVVKDLAGTA